MNLLGAPLSVRVAARISSCFCNHLHSCLCGALLAEQPATPPPKKQHRTLPRRYREPTDWKRRNDQQITQGVSLHRVCRGSGARFRCVARVGRRDADEQWIAGGHASQDQPDRCNRGRRLDPDHRIPWRHLQLEWVALDSARGEPDRAGGRYLCARYSTNHQFHAFSSDRASPSTP